MWQNYPVLPLILLFMVVLRANLVYGKQPSKKDCTTDYINYKGGENGQTIGLCPATCPKDFRCTVAAEEGANQINPDVDDDTCLCKKRLGNSTGNLVQKDGSKYVVRTHCARDPKKDGQCGNRCAGQPAPYNVPYVCTATLYDSMKEVQSSGGPTPEKVFCACAGPQAAAYDCTHPMYVDKKKGKGLCPAACSHDFDCKAIVTDSEEERNNCLCSAPLGGKGEADVIMAGIPTSNQVIAEGIYEYHQVQRHYKINVTCVPDYKAGEASEFVCPSCSDIHPVKIAPFRCTAYGSKDASTQDFSKLLDFCACAPKVGKNPPRENEEDSNGDSNSSSRQNLFPAILSRLADGLETVRNNNY